MSSYFRLAAEALPNPGETGSWERRMVDGIRALGSFEGRTVGRLSGRGSPLAQLKQALSPEPAYMGSTRAQLLVGGGNRALWLACVRARANVPASQSSDFIAPNDTPLENLPGWTQNPGNGAQPGDLKIVGNAVAQARLIENGVAYIGPPTGKHNKKNSAALLETVQQQGYVAPLVEDSGNWAGTTYDPATGKLKADKSVNGTVTPLGEVAATVASGDQIGGITYNGDYYITHAGTAVAGPFSLGGSHGNTTASGLIAKGAATNAWIDDYSADEQTSAPTVDPGIGGSVPPTFGVNGALQTTLGGGGTTITPALPAGISVGDYLEATVCTASSSAVTHSVSAGWNLLHTTLFAGSDGLGVSPRMSTYWRIATGSDSAPVITFSGAVTRGEARCARFAGVDTSDGQPHEAISVDTYENYNTNGNKVQGLALTLARQGSLLIDKFATFTGVTGGLMNAAGTGWTEYFDHEIGGAGPDCTFAGRYKARTDPGTTPVEPITPTVGIEYMVVSYALKSPDA